MAYLSIQVVVRKDEGESRVPVISPKPLKEIVHELYRNKCWDVVRVTNNSGDFSYPVVNGIVQKEVD